MTPDAAAAATRISSGFSEGDFSPLLSLLIIIDAVQTLYNPLIPAPRSAATVGYIFSPCSARPSGFPTTQASGERKLLEFSKSDMQDIMNPAGEEKEEEGGGGKIR